MIHLNAFRESPRARSVYVNKIGAIYGVDGHTIKKTLIAELPNAPGNLDGIAAVHLIWPMPAWITAMQLHQFALGEYERGSTFLSLPGRH
jgi:hypothetical protein